MNRNFLRVFFVVFLIKLCPAIVEAQEISVEVRSAAFFHSSKLFREIYGNIGPCYELEASTPLCYCLDGWANFDWFSKHRKKDCEECASRVGIANISFGLKYPYCLCEQVTAYIGIGPSFSRIWLKEKSQCCRERLTKLVIGGVLKTGIYYFINECIFLDLFVDYLYQPVHFKRRVDIGGLKTGLGAGVKF